MAPPGRCPGVGVPNLEVPNHMDTGTLVTILVVVLVVLVLLFLVRAAGVGRRRPKLRPLPAESRERYIGEWDEIETKFVDAPEQAVREAESLVLSMLREGGHDRTRRASPGDGLTRLEGGRRHLRPDVADRREA